MNKLLITILLLIPSALLSAKEIRPIAGEASCTPLDYRDELPPVRNQGPIGWCYAFAASDLVSHKLQQNISPIDMALNYNQSQNQEAIEQASRNSIRVLLRSLGLESRERKRPASLTAIRNQFMNSFVPVSQRESGWVDRSITATQDMGGFCLDRPIEGLAQSNEDFIAVMAMLGHMRETYIRSRENDPSLRAAQYICEQFKTPETLVLPISWIGLETLSHYLEGELLSDILYVLMNENCRERIQAHFEPQQITLRNLNDDLKLQHINRILESGSILSINFMSQMLTGPNTQGEYHSATIVGRRQNNESSKCEYLVRNSWGPDCERYMTNECEDGHIWISQDDIVEYAQELNHL